MLMFLAKTVGIVALCVALFFVNAFVGNPVSALLARVSAHRYVAQEYGHLDVQIDKVGYNFKNTNYFAKVSSPTSVDTHFTVYISMLGQVERDTYESVTGGFNTWQRLNEEYRMLVKEAAAGLVLDCDIDTLSGDLMGSGYDCGWMEEYGLPESGLKVDGKYDILELGRQHGGIYLCVYDEEVSYNRGAELLAYVAGALEESGIPFRAIDFSLRKPKSTEGSPNDDRILWLLDFPAEDIAAPDLESRVREAHRRTMDYFGEENYLE